jgi:tetratricopeptide (TPR) repeat protein
MAGRNDAALPLLEEALTLTKRIGLKQSEAGALIDLAEGYLAAGRTDEAQRTVAEGLALAQAQGERGNETTALRILADIAAAAEPLDVADAEEAYRRARASAEALRMSPEAARCQLGLGRMLDRAGRREDARCALAVAAAEFETMQMSA